MAIRIPKEVQLLIVGFLVCLTFAAIRVTVRSASLITTKTATEKVIVLYRGIPSNHEGFEAALQGFVSPLGGHSDYVKHVKGDTRSIFVSWTTNKELAYNIAQSKMVMVRGVYQKMGGTGVVLRKEFKRYELINTDNCNRWKENEYLTQGHIKGCIVYKVPEVPLHEIP